MSVPVCTFFPDFPEENHQPPLTLGFTTDTSVPQTIVPVFLIHSMAHPFCTKHGCACQQSRTQKAELLARIGRAELTLQAFHDASEGGR